MQQDQGWEIRCGQIWSDYIQCDHGGKGFCEKSGHRVDKGVGGIPIFSICPSVSTQCFPLAETKKATVGKGAWEMMLPALATCKAEQSKGRAESDQQNCDHG